MKYVACTECGDILRLIHIERRCSCFSTGGRTTIGNKAYYYGSALPLEFSLGQLRLAKELQPMLGKLYGVDIKVVGRTDSHFKNAERPEKKSTLTVDFL